jgi:hypothetical protein
MVLFRQFCVAVLFFCIHQIHAQGSAGFNSSFIVLAINGGSNAYYDLQSSTGNPDFNNANLGTFTSSNSLVIKGAEHNVWKCSGCDLTSTRLYYRIYSTGVSPGSFSNLNLPWSSGGNNGCGGQDQQWLNVSGNIDVLACLIPGSYTLEVYSDASITCGGSVSANNNGSNYKASFSVGVNNLNTISSVVNINSVCSNAIVNLSLDYASSNNIISYQWQSSLNNGVSWTNIATSNASSLALTILQNIKVRCKITMCNSLISYSSSISISLITPPALSLNSSTLNKCYGVNSGLVSLSNGSGSYNIFNWDSNFSTSGNQNIGWIINSNLSSSYTLTAINSTSNCTNAVILDLIVFSAPVISAGNDINLCQGSSVNLSSTSNFSFSLNINSLSGGEMSDVTWMLTNLSGAVVAQGGNYSSGSSNLINIPLISNQNHTLNISTIGGYDDNDIIYSADCNGNVICSGSLYGGNTITQILAPCSINNNLTYLWTPSTGLSNPSIFNPVANPIIGTTYSLAASNNGCSNIDPVIINIVSIPSAIAGADLTGAYTCGKNTVTVNATALNNNETGAWSVVTQGTGATLPGLFSAFTSPTDDFTGSYGGTYTLGWTVTNTTTNCTNTDNMVVTFNQPITSSLGSSIGDADFLWNGLTSVDWSTGGNWFRNVSGEYQLQTGTIEPTNTNQVFTLTSAQGGVCIGSNMPTIGNGDNALDVFVGSGITLNLASGSLNLSGNLVNNGTINAAQGTINFIGSTNATISGSGTTTLNNVTINKSSSANLTLSTNVAVNGILNMTQGNVVTAASPNGLLTLGTSSVDHGTLSWTSGNIVGPFRRFFTTAATQGNEGLFPVGTATYQRYAKVNFTASPGSNQTLTAWYKAGAPMSANIALYNGLPLTTQDGQLIQNYSADGYWQIDPTDNNYTAAINSANYSIDLYANNLTGMQDPTICRIIKAAGSNTSSSNHVQWQGCGTHTTIPTGTSASAFVINSTVASGFSWFGAGTSNNQALPVELTSFSGNCADGKVDLEWSTATEHNSAYFQVEYSRDGSVWQNIGEVKAAGNSVQNINHTLTHEQVASGNNYYRLRQVDIDGVEELYDAIAVNCAAGSDQYMMSYPNPSEQNFQVALLDENLIGTATLSMVDARGKLIHSELLEVKAGTNLFLFNNTGLAPGIYYVKISKGTYSSEVVKQVVR